MYFYIINIYQNLKQGVSLICKFNNIQGGWFIVIVNSHIMLIFYKNTRHTENFVLINRIL